MAIPALLMSCSILLHHKVSMPFKLVVVVVARNFFVEMDFTGNWDIVITCKTAPRREAFILQYVYMKIGYIDSDMLR
jgi:hypothetical protein